MTTASPFPPGRVQVRVCGRFAVVVDEREVVLPTHAQRLLAYLSIGRRPGVSHRRSHVAELLWPDARVALAHGSLRTALWRIRQVDQRLVDTHHASLRLGAAVAVDLHELLDRAERLLAGDDASVDVEVDFLRGDLLAGWEEDWLLLERERTRQTQIHALEALSRRLRLDGQHARAVDAALAAVAAEPMRESAHETLIVAHLADGNRAAAHRQYRAFAALLFDELGVRPSAGLAALIEAPVRPT